MCAATRGERRKGRAIEIERKLKIGVVGAGVPAITAVPTAFAMQGRSPTDTSPRTAVEQQQETVTGLRSADHEEEVDDEIGIGEEIEFLNELSGAIVEALTEAKIAHTVQTADVRIVVWDENDEAANEIVEGVLDELFEEFEEDFDLEDLDEEEIEELRAEATAVRVALDAVSISYEIEVDDLGIELPLFDKDNEAAAVRAALDAAGIPDEVENDGFGIGWPLIDEKDEDAWEVIDQPYTTSGANSKSTTTTSRTTKKTKTERC